MKIKNTGVIYQNPKPHVKSVHAYFPSVVVMDNGEMLASLGLGEAFEAVNLRSHIARSKDNGETWELEGLLYPGTTDRVTSDCCRITAFPGGEVVAFMVRSDRTMHQDEGLTNHENLGFVPTELLLFRSYDYGHTWSKPETMVPPLEGPSFEMCCPITPLSDERWIIPTQTWPGWDGSCPNGIKMIAFISEDQGKSWPEYMNVMSEPEGRVFFWESKIVEFSDKQLMAVAWAYDDIASVDKPIQYSLSKDGGKTWSRPSSTELIGQTPAPYVLPDGRVLCVYRRTDEPGLWANISRMEGDKWVNQSTQVLWGQNTQGLVATSENMAQNFNALKFGAPCINMLPDGNVFVSFWCYENAISVIRWFKLEV